MLASCGPPAGSSAVAVVKHPGAAHAFATLCTDHTGMLDAGALMNMLKKKGAGDNSRHCGDLMRHADEAGLIDYPTLLAAVSEAISSYHDP